VLKGLTLAFLLMLPLTAKGQAVRILPVNSQKLAKPLPTRTTDVKAYYAFDAIEQLADAYRIVIGFVDDESVHRNPLLTFHLDHATVPEAMDELTNADPAYSWRFEPDGAVTVYSRVSTFTLPDVVIADFRVQKLNREGVSEALGELPEITNWLTEHGCVRNQAISTTGNPPPDNQRVTFEITGKTLRQVLNEVAARMSFHYWALSRSIEPDAGCTVGIVLEPVGTRPDDFAP